MSKLTDSPRWCDQCRSWGNHHTDRHPNVADIIRPIINGTYGKSEWIDAMIEDVAKTIEGDEQPNTGRSREDRIMLRCWDWMSGGTTAEYVARKIEAALVEAGL